MRMGQAGSTGDGTVKDWMIAGPGPTWRARQRARPNTAGCWRTGQCSRASEMCRMRRDYLNRLGISRDGCSLVGPSRTPRLVAEESDCLELAAAAPAPALPRDPANGIRFSFLQRLSYRHIWVPQARRLPRHQTVIFFDWDDTLICTTYLKSLQDYTPAPEVQRQLRGIERAAAQLLGRALLLGRTFIVTNAMAGWVEYSAARFMPGLLPILEQVRVISARRNHQAQYPCDVGQWKVQAFLELQRQMDNQIITNLVSFGDADFEMDAVHAMSQAFARSMVKTIRFRQNPSPEELLKQLELVAQKVDMIVLNASNLKISLAPK